MNMKCVTCSHRYVCKYVDSLKEIYDKFNKLNNESLNNGENSTNENKNTFDFDVTCRMYDKEKNDELRDIIGKLKEFANIHNLPIVTAEQHRYEHRYVRETPEMIINCIKDRTCNDKNEIPPTPIDTNVDITTDCIGQVLTLRLPFASTKVFKLPKSCIECPVGYHSEDCGRSFPFSEDNHIKLPENCKLSIITPNEIQKVINWYIKRDKHV